jgi:hypothetical protein
MKQFCIALVTLAVVHSLVSFGAFRVFTTREVKYYSEAGERTEFSNAQTTVESVSWPSVIEWYMWSGYVGLAAAALYVLYHYLRHGHS